MSATRVWSEPDWLAGSDACERLGFYLNIAALFGTKKGTLRALAHAVACQPSALSQAKHSGTISPRLAIKIEETVGRDIMPRELLCPEFFAVGEAS